MFHLSTRTLVRLSNRCFSKRAKPFLTLLGPSHRPLARQSLKFFSNGSEKKIEYIPEKALNKGMKQIVKSNGFIIGSTKITLTIYEFVNDNTRIVIITEYNLVTRLHLGQLWLRIRAAQTLLEKLDEFIKAIEKNNVQFWVNKRHKKCFQDHEANIAVELKFEAYRSFSNMFYLKIHSFNLKENKQQSIIVPINGVTLFRDKLDNTLRKYGRINDTNRPKLLENLCKARSFVFATKRYFLNLLKGNADGNILILFVELNQETSKKREMYLPISAAQTFCDLLENAYKTVQRYEGRISSDPPYDVKYEKSFIYQNEECTVQAAVSEISMRHLGDMVLMIRRRNLDNDLQSSLFIRSKGVSLLLLEYQAILREYERLRPTLTGVRLANPSSTTDEQWELMSNQELTASKTEANRITELGGLEEERQNEMAIPEEVCQEPK